MAAGGAGAQRARQPVDEGDMERVAAARDDVHPANQRGPPPSPSAAHRPQWQQESKGGRGKGRGSHRGSVSRTTCGCIAREAAPTVSTPLAVCGQIEATPIEAAIKGHGWVNGINRERANDNLKGDGLRQPDAAEGGDVLRHKDGRVEGRAPRRPQRPCGQGGREVEPVQRVVLLRHAQRRAGLDRAWGPRKNTQAQCEPPGNAPRRDPAPAPHPCRRLRSATVRLSGTRSGRPSRPPQRRRPAAARTTGKAPVGRRRRWWS